MYLIKCSTGVACGICIITQYQLMQFNATIFCIVFLLRALTQEVLAITMVQLKQNKTYIYVGKVVFFNLNALFFSHKI